MKLISLIIYGNTVFYEFINNNWLSSIFFWSIKIVANQKSFLWTKLSRDVVIRNEKYSMYSLDNLLKKKINKKINSKAKTTHKTYTFIFADIFLCNFMSVRLNLRNYQRFLFKSGNKTHINYIVNVNVVSHFCHCHWER